VAAVYKHHFLSSASEDDEFGQNGSVQRNRERGKHRDLIKGVPQGTTHSSVNNGTRVNLPLYGQRPLQTQRTIRDVTYKR